MGRDKDSPEPQIFGPGNKGWGAENQLPPPPSAGEVADGPCSAPGRDMRVCAAALPWCWGADQSLLLLPSHLGVPPGRGNCPLTSPLPFDLIYTDYHGLQQMKQHMGLSFKKYR